MTITNHHLFSEAFLNDLAQTKVSPDIPSAVQQTIREWRDEYPNLDAWGDLLSYLTQTLSALGFSYKRVETPTHFVLFSDQTHSWPLGILLPVADDDIGRTTKGRHHQVKLIKLLKEQQLTWGIVTNGHDWRLCYAKSPSPYEVYLQADLDSLLDPRQLADFVQFYRFFNRQAFAFQSDSDHKESKQGLDLLLADSEAATQSIERHLKNRVDDILQALCLGFVDDDRGNDLSRADLDDIYYNAIVLLYRTLFLFYAEARRLLPVENDAYRQYSLEAILEDARRWQIEGYRNSEPYSLWTRLATLCGIVDLGDQDAGVNPYNGGLFSDAENPYLRIHEIRDNYLAPAVFHLAFMESKSNWKRIEYRDLSVRHLGTLYEGMLEYRLNMVREEPVVVRESKGKRTYIPQSVATPKKGETILQLGQVYFADDKGERKSSGSYYTPEDVVQYIVSETLLPKLKERAKPIRKLAEQANHERLISVTQAEQTSLESYADRQALALVESELLSLKILDPAMGSAHFLVSAGQMMTNFIIETLNELDWPNDISTDPLLWKRRVVERCLYGVDVNPLAQELAKLSLWLSSAAVGKPLTFLDHHLKVGNSLYGAPLERLAILPTTNNTDEQTENLFHQTYQRVLKELLVEFDRIIRCDSDRIEDVKNKNEAYYQAFSLTQRLRDIANVWLGTLFCLTDEEDEPLTEEFYFNLLQEINKERSRSPEDWEFFVSGQHVLQFARKLARDHHFFHWELEFPDVVVNERCHFDLVIANPPYVGMSPTRPILNLFETAKCRDLYAWILERALLVLSDDGHLGTIIPLSIMFAGDKSSLREKLCNEQGEVKLSSFDNRPDAIFEAPGLPPNRQRTTIVVISRTGKKNRILTTDYLRWLRSERPVLFQNLRYADTTHLATKNYFPSIGNNRLVDFYSKLLLQPKKIKDYVQNKGEEFLCVPSAACYYISAVPENLGRRNQELLWFENEVIRNAIFAIINSNVFYWFWRSRSDGFWVSREQILSMPIPDLDINNDELLSLARQLQHKSSDYAVTQKINNKFVTSYLFNRRMDLLIKIDDSTAKTRGLN